MFLLLHKKTNRNISKQPLHKQNCVGNTFSDKYPYMEETSPATSETNIISKNNCFESQGQLVDTIRNIQTLQLKLLLKHIYNILPIFLTFSGT